MQFAEALADLSNLEISTGHARRSVEEIREELYKHNNDGYAVELSAHAFTNISARLHALTCESKIIYDDVTRPDDHNKSLLIPSQLRAFIISLIAKAKIDEDFKHKGREYHYNIEMVKWSNSHHMLVLTAIVEESVVKTGYFNWIVR